MFFKLQCVIICIFRWYVHVYTIRLVQSLSIQFVAQSECKQVAKDCFMLVSSYIKKHKSHATKTCSHAHSLRNNGQHFVAHSLVQLCTLKTILSHSRTFRMCQRKRHNIKQMAKILHKTLFKMTTTKLPTINENPT